MHRFPYGEHMRFALYSAPTFCVLIGLGIGAVLKWFARRRRSRCTGLLGRAGAVGALRRRLDRSRPDASVQVGADAAGAGLRPVVLVRPGPRQRIGLPPHRLKTNLAPKTFLRRVVGTLLVQPADLFAAARPRGTAAPGARLRSEPLRCVLFRDMEQDPDNTAVDRWLTGMERSYKLVARDSYPMPIYGKWNAPPQSIQNCIEVFKFVPTGRKSPQGRRRPCDGSAG